MHKYCRRREYNITKTTQSGGQPLIISKFSEYSYLINLVEASICKDTP